MIEVVGNRAVTWARITDDEGWERGFWRAVALHEHLGRPVRLLQYTNGKCRKVCELVTIDGFLRVRYNRNEQEQREPR